MFFSQDFAVLLINQNKSYARLTYLRNQTQKKISLRHIRSEEKRFVNQFGVSSDELMAKYVLTPEKIEILEAMLLSKEMQPLNQEERQYINEEYGANRGR